MEQMEKIVKAAILIPYNSKNEILLQLRDEEPEIDKWVLFGGGVDGDETIGEALRREIKEELDWDLEGIGVETVGIHPAAENNPRELHVFAVKLESLDGLVLGEGKDLRFFNQEEIKNLPIGFNQREVIEDFFKSQNI